MIILSTPGCAVIVGALTVFSSFSILANGFALPAAFRSLYSPHGIASPNANSNQHGLFRRGEHITWAINEGTKERVTVEKIYVDPNTNDWFKGKESPWKKYQDQRNMVNTQATKVYANATKAMKDKMQKIKVGQEFRKLVAENAKDLLVAIEQHSPGFFLKVKDGAIHAPDNIDRPTFHDVLVGNSNPKSALKPHGSGIIIPARGPIADAYHQTLKGQWITNSHRLQVGVKKHHDHHKHKHEARDYGKVDMPWKWPPPEIVQLGMTVLKPLHEQKMVLVGYGNEDSTFNRMPVQKIVLDPDVSKMFKGYRESDFRQLAGTVGTSIINDIISENWVLVGRMGSGVENITFVDDETYLWQGNEKTGQSQGQNVAIKDVVSSPNKPSTEEKVAVKEEKAEANEDKAEAKEEKAETEEEETETEEEETETKEENKDEVEMENGNAAVPDDGEEKDGEKRDEDEEEDNNEDEEDENPQYTESATLDQDGETE